MDENKLQKICLVITIAGIFSLILISKNIEPTEVKISQISKELLQQEVKIKGVVEKIEQKNVLTILMVSDEKSSIEITTQKEGSLKIKDGDHIEIIGILKEYKNKLQIEATTIKKV